MLVDCFYCGFPEGGDDGGAGEDGGVSDVGPLRDAERAPGVLFVCCARRRKYQLALLHSIVPILCDPMERLGEQRYTRLAGFRPVTYFISPDTTSMLLPH